jgi:hypothetical protein
MIAAAKETCPGATFHVADVMDLPDIGPYDVVFTDRMLINLGSIAMQRQAIENLASLTQGSLILIENSRQTKDAQNDLREVVGLPRRRDAEFNLFLNDEVVIPHLKSLFSTVEVETSAASTTSCSMSCCRRHLAMLATTNTRSCKQSLICARRYRSPRGNLAKTASITAGAKI